MTSQTTEVHRTPMTRDPRRATPRHIIIKNKAHNHADGAAAKYARGKG